MVMLKEAIPIVVGQEVEKLLFQHTGTHYLLAVRRQ